MLALQGPCNVCGCSLVNFSCPPDFTSSCLDSNSKTFVALANLEGNVNKNWIGNWTSHNLLVMVIGSACLLIS